MVMSAAPKKARKTLEYRRKFRKATRRQAGIGARPFQFARTQDAVGQTSAFRLSVLLTADGMPRAGVLHDTLQYDTAQPSSEVGTDTKVSRDVDGLTGRVD